MELTRDYYTTLTQIHGLISGEKNLIANLANISSVLKMLDGYFWVGFYIVEGNVLVLGPFQGPVACTRIAFNKGVCGTAWAKNEIITVPDVHKFPGHIACNAASLSEIVVPIHNNDGKVVMVLDADSDRLNAFGPEDAEALSKLALMITPLLEL
jgi:GAF domain-containing protein